MADRTYLDLEGLKKYDELIKGVVAEKESALGTAVTVESDRAKAAEQAISQAIGAETTRATKAEGDLQTAINAINNETTGILAQAKTYADGKDTAIQVAQSTADAAQASASTLSALIGAVPSGKTVKEYIDDKAIEASGKATEVEGKLNDEINRAKGVEGNLDALTTDAKNNLVSAINEVNTNANTASATADKVSALVGDEADYAGKTVKQYIDDESSNIRDIIGATSGLPTPSESLVENIADIDGKIVALDTKVGEIPASATATTVAGYAKELADAASADALAAGKVTIVEAVGTGSVLKTYTFYQGGEAEVNKIGTIDLAKDLVVTAGEVVKNPAGQPEGTYLKLTIANQEAPVYINVVDLVNDFTVEQDAAQVQLEISDTREISAAIVAGSITKTELATAVVNEIEAATTAIGVEPDEGVAGSGLKKRVKALEDAIGEGGSVDEQIAAAIDALDATVDTTADPKGLNITVVEENGKLKSVTGSVETITETQINALFGK